MDELEKILAEQITEIINDNILDKLIPGYKQNKLAEVKRQQRLQKLKDIFNETDKM